MYNKGLIDSDEDTAKSKRLYKSKDWMKLRHMALERDNYLCQICLRKNRFTKANLVHHMIYVKSDFEKALDLDNLMCVCSKCHNQIHSRDEKEVFTNEKIKIKVRTIKL
ncbi:MULTISPECIES: HNH endonuclease [Staphylococcus]|uniref:Putative HNH nuclease YajD n=1 Tax=Staphylococcus equorum TaxID=246432 RepID=A0AAW7AIS8_9STAP|nr:HNH endonuclease signature motif containing protein [Staphylococcus equorum]MDK9867046.1 HNH endonuclease signature motif containing protein [Staphylococcus equorum]MDK9869992.1 HNH endonuclease signature motif containing protein [Staphylococcus equorum]